MALQYVPTSNQNNEKQNIEPRKINSNSFFATKHEMEAAPFSCWREKNNKGMERKRCCGFVVMNELMKDGVLVACELRG